MSVSTRSGDFREVLSMARRPSQGGTKLTAHGNHLGASTAQVASQRDEKGSA